MTVGPDREAPSEESILGFARRDRRGGLGAEPIINVVSQIASIEDPTERARAVTGVAAMLGPVAAELGEDMLVEAASADPRLPNAATVLGLLAGQAAIEHNSRLSEK